MARRGACSRAGPIALRRLEIVHNVPCRKTCARHGFGANAMVAARRSMSGPGGASGGVQEATRFAFPNVGGILLPRLALAPRRYKGPLSTCENIAPTERLRNGCNALPEPCQSSSGAAQNQGQMAHSVSQPTRTRSHDDGSGPPVAGGRRRVGERCGRQQPRANAHGTEDAPLSVWKHGAAAQGVGCARGGAG
jgi:hypothetical protein